MDYFDSYFGFIPWKWQNLFFDRELNLLGYLATNKDFIGIGEKTDYRENRKLSSTSDNYYTMRRTVSINALAVV